MLRLLLFFLLSQSALGDDDVPHRGASYFDYLLKEAGITYDGREQPLTPHPYRRMAEAINQFTPFFSAVIPFGRSLQKMASYPQSLKYPRLLLASSADKAGLNTHLEGRLFIGYVEPTGKLEVISYNNQLGRFEFQIVDDLIPGGKAKIRYARRELCLRCHQGGVPIFAGGDWLEATAFNHSLRSLVEEAMNSNQYLGVPLARDQKAEAYDLWPRPERYDDMVNIGARLIGYQKAWQELCPATYQRSDCWSTLLSWMIFSNLYPDQGFPVPRRLLDQFYKVLGDGTIDIPEDRIPDHDPVQNGKLSYQLPKNKDPSRNRPNLRLILPSKKDQLGDQYYKLYILVRSMGESLFTEKDFELLREHIGDPRGQQTKAIAYDLSLDRWHATDGYCIPSALGMKDVLDQKKSELKVFCYGSPMKLMRSAFQKIHHSQGAIIVRESVLKQLDGYLATQFWQDLCCQEDQAISQETYSKSKSYLIKKDLSDQRLKPFFEFCSECHLHQDLPPPFLAGASEKMVLDQLRSRKKLIEFRLREGQMPPHFASKIPNPEQRQDLLQIILGL
ncbi:hypothetical protein [Pseudobacteriovorax antillogorgiicola]|uniref:Cytochrome c domain-containing protein n=1 Tax=Pseudobacteriovorax antillogorgiicola TaxID=1513793 RepID=A0A1Y6CES5_9BACT|nr:hypothetical protein [Pseudobacteriovorax antillogorgiicola]TCS47581.1 hypothetical protein EDD56_12022 [Pseudobacteriovorax antillogorgiicola]SMF60367.1 hypothetical protein SAMN06296036_120118 [Pseudobacteriovorax antillogorgiicola]